MKNLMPQIIPARAGLIRLSRKLMAFALVAIALSWPLPGPAKAAAGDLDSEFGGGGIVTTNVGLSEEAMAIALQPDGKIVVAGETSALGPSNFAVVRYNTNGTLDDSFGTGGVVTTGFDLGSGANDLAIQPDGKIIAAGVAFSNASNDFDFALVRYNANGSLDMTFGAGGKVITDFHGSQVIATLALQPDGKILAGGNSDRMPAVTDFALARYNADGTLDLSFGNGGIVTTDFFGGSNAILDLAIQPNNKIVAAGIAFKPNTGRPGLVLARYNADGSLDPAFGSGGKMIDAFDSADAAVGMELQPDGKIVATGTSFSPVTGGDFALLRFKADGSADRSFGSRGKVTTDILGGDRAQALAIYPDGKIVVGGTALQPGVFRNEDFALARYNADGSLDKMFGATGKITTDLSGNDDVDLLNALVIQPDGKIIAAGGTRITNRDIFLARYETIMPRIKSVSIMGKRLIVSGEDFDDGAVILINGQQQKTSNKSESPRTLLVSKKGGKKIKAGDTVILQIRNSDGTLSPEFVFTRPAL